MALDKQLFPMSLEGGLDLKTDDKQVMPGKFLVLENAIFKTIKKFRKRNGHERLPNTTYIPSTPGNSILSATVPEGRSAFTYKDELLLNDNFNLYGFSESKQAWAYKGRSTTVEIDETSIATSINDQTMADSAINSTLGQTLYAWSDSLTGLCYSIFDTVSGQNLTGQVVANASGLRARCLSLGSSLYLFYIISGTLYGIRITSAGAAAPVAVVADLDATFPNYDAEVIGGNIYIGYAGSSSNIWVRQLSAALAVTASVSKSEDATSCISLFGDASNNVWVPYGNDTSGIKAFVMDSTLTTTLLAPTVVDASTTDPYNVTGTFAQGKGFIFYDVLEIPLPGPLISQYLDPADPSFVQPAVNATVVVPFNNASTDRIGEIVVLFGDAGQLNYYRITNAVANTSYTLLNLGYAGNTAPGGSVTAITSGGDYRFDLFSTQFANAYIMVNTLTLAGVVGTPVEFARSVALVSKAFTQDTVPHVVALHPAALQPTYFLLNLYNTSGTIGESLYANIAGKIFSTLGGTIPEFPLLARVNQMVDVASVALLQRGLLFTTSSFDPTFTPGPNVYTQTGVSLAVMDFGIENAQSEVLGDNTHISGGALLMYDGTNVVEHGFHLYPENLDLETQATGGSLTAGRYGYQVIYEWRDEKGQVHRSAPSPVISITAIADGYNELTIPYLSMTNKVGVSLVIYRTVANGTVYYRINSPTTPIPNITAGVNTITYEDKVSDASILGNEQLYTLGEVENIGAPAPFLLASFKNRLLEIPSGNRTELWYSKQVVPGYPVEFSDLFVMNLGTAGGDVTALGVIDDKIILFRDGSISYVVGTGPAPSGANNDFTDPIPIASDVGCSDKDSVVENADGIIFRSKKGMCLLDRSLAVHYMDDGFNGAAVDPYMNFQSKCASLVGNQNQARFIMSNGQAIVYDYNVRQWATFTSMAGVSSVVLDGLYHFLAADGYMWRETPDVYTDNGAFIKLKFVTSWLQAAGIQGFQRVYHCQIIGGYKGPNELSMSLAYDFDPTVTQTATVAAAVSVVPLQYQLEFTRQKCESFQLTVQDNASTPVGEGVDISAITFEFGMKRGTNKLRAAKVIS